MASASKKADNVKKMISLCDEVKNELSSDKRIDISYDEWNVWYHSIEADKNIKFWEFAPNRLEDIYNLEDALAVAEYIITMLKNADRIKIGCMAQLVNVLGVFMTDGEGNILKQSTYYPYSDACRYAKGKALIPTVECDTFSAENKGTKIENVDLVSAVATKNGDDATLFIVNRSETEDIECEIDINTFVKPHTVTAKTLYHDDIKAINTFENPENVTYTQTPCIEKEGKLTLTLKKHSFTFISLS